MRAAGRKIKFTLHFFGLFVFQCFFIWFFLFSIFLFSSLQVLFLFCYFFILVIFAFSSHACVGRHPEKFYSLFFASKKLKLFRLAVVLLRSCVGRNPEEFYSLLQVKDFAVSLGSCTTSLLRRQEFRGILFSFFCK